MNTAELNTAEDTAIRAIDSLLSALGRAACQAEADSCEEGGDLFAEFMFHGAESAEYTPLPKAEREASAACKAQMLDRMAVATKVRAELVKALNYAE